MPEHTRWFNLPPLRWIVAADLSATDLADPGAGAILYTDNEPPVFLPPPIPRPEVMW